MGKITFQLTSSAILGERTLCAREGRQLEHSKLIDASHFDSPSLAMLTHRSAGNDKLGNAITGGAQQ
jgi:hypothetical protein